MIPEYITVLCHKLEDKIIYF
ncbi:hypothetical protein CY0110_17612 [Crocosphaera chwakensis CCY0110]|uniref:Uncharacterized protein n=1 Tax=Crocosphaera chwakensis CCY0110 TaxID=391612 RepID=A3IIK4_9CHRO|nr:hypothetical protein CY0110_17612 [Crocosphaera chwakensis CCY0110]